MSKIFDRLYQHQIDFKNILQQKAFLSEETHHFDWENKIYHNAYVRRAHLDVIDLRQTKKLYMMHLCVFPQVWDSAPIYGFDLVAGPNKITGAFHDYSPIGDSSHPLCEWFNEETEKYSWKRTRELPQWAKNIFSEKMIAASNIQSELEMDDILNLSKQSLLFYLNNIHKYQSMLPYDKKIVAENYTEQQNFYCENQKQNPHTKNVMKSLGFSEELIEEFVETCLFPEI